MRTKKGVVTSAKMTGTVTVTVNRSVFHPIYRKRFRKSKNFLADAGDFDLAAGDLVVISECRPLSKRKCFRVTEVLEQAPRVSEIKEEESVEEAIHREKVIPAAVPTPIKEAEEEKEAKEAEETSAPDTFDSSASSASSASSSSSKE